jgi:hypothetical protein
MYMGSPNRGNLADGLPFRVFPPRSRTVGAPSFAQFAKGGNHERIRNVFMERAWVASAASLPALANNARTGHPLYWYRARDQMPEPPPLFLRRAIGVGPNWAYLL